MVATETNSSLELNLNNEAVSRLVCNSILTNSHIIIASKILYSLLNGLQLFNVFTLEAALPQIPCCVNWSISLTKIKTSTQMAPPFK